MEIIYAKYLDWTTYNIKISLITSTIVINNDYSGSLKFPLFIWGEYK